MSVPYNAQKAALAAAPGMYPAAYKDYGVPDAPPIALAPAAVPGQVTPAQGAPAPAAPASGGPPKYADYLRLQESTLGRRLTPDDLLNTREAYRHNVLRPENFRRGAKQFELAAIDEGFNFNADQIEQAYLAQPGVAGAPGEDNGISMLRENLAAAAGGLVNYGAGILHLGDYAARGLRGLINYAGRGASLAYNGYDTGQNLLDQEGQTFLGQWGDSAAAAANELSESNRSSETIRQDEAYAAAADALEKNPDSNIIDSLALMLTSGPRRLTRQVSGVLGEVGGGVGVLGLGRKALLQLPKAAQRLTALTTLGAPGGGRATADWEQTTLALPIEQFSESTQAASREMQEMGIPKDQADAAAKQTAVSGAIPFVLATNVGTNVGLSLIPGLGKSEELFARLGLQGQVGKRILGAAAEETAEESLAGGLQKAGENIATNMATGSNIPVLQGTARPTAEGGVLGFLSGGTSGVIPQPNAAPPAPTPTPQPTGTPTPAPAAAGTPAPAAAPTAAPAGPAASPLTTTYTPGPGIAGPAFDSVKKNIQDTLSTRLAPKTSQEHRTVKKFSVADIVQAAETEAATLAGADWANMSPIQKLEAVETAAVAMNKVAKHKGPDLANALDNIRQMINAASAPPAGVVSTGVPAGITPTPAPAPTTQPKGKKPLKGASPAAAAATTSPDTPAAAAVTPTAPTPVGNVAPDSRFDDLTPGDKQAVTEELVNRWNANNPTQPITFGQAHTVLTNPQNTRGKTVSQIANDIGNLAKTVPATAAPAPAPAPAKGTKPLGKKAVPKPPKEASTKPAEPAATPAPATTPAAPAPAAEAPAAKTEKKEVPKPPEKKSKPLGKNKEAPKTEPAKAEPAKEEGKKPLGKKSVPTPPAKTEGRLPDDLRGAKPNYSYGEKKFTLDFESDIDKALYIIAGRNKLSAKDKRYVDFVTGELGITEDEARFQGQQVKDRIKAIAKDAKAGNLRIPAQEASAPSPKPQAPAGAGAAEASAKPKTTESIGEAVTRITNNELSAGQEAELVDAIKIGRESGDPGPVSAAIKELEKDGEEFTADQKRDLRALTTPQATRAPVVENEPEVPSESLELLGPSPAVGIKDIEDMINAAQNPPAGKSQLGEVLRALTKSPHTTKSQKWLAGKLAPYADKLGVKIKMDPKLNAFGSFDLIDNKVLVRHATPLTVLHESLHAVTADVVLGNFVSKEADALRKTWNELTAHARKYMDDKKAQTNIELLPSDNKEKLELLQKLLKVELQYGGTKYAVSGTHELMTVALTDPVVRSFLAAIPASGKYKGNNLWEEFKNLILDQLAKVFKAKPKQRSLLDEIVDLTAATTEYTVDQGARPSLPIFYNATPAIQENERQIQQTIVTLKHDMGGDNAVTSLEHSAGAAVPPKKSLPQTSFSKFAQRFQELFTFAGIALEYAEQLVRREGGNVTPENSPYYAMRKFTSDMAEMKNIDNLTFVEPVRNWITENWRKFGAVDAETFRKDLDKFMQTIHLLRERNPTIWAETVKLTPAGELSRARLIDDAYAGNITGPQLNAQLISLAGRTATIPLDQWTQQTKFAKDNTELRKQLAELAKKGYTESALAPFNKIVDGVRQQARTRMINSGKVDANDPFADRGWEWYVPLKGHLSISEEAADYDIGFTRGETKAFRNSPLKVLQGRQSTAHNALTQLVEDMNDAATAQAEGEFKSRLFEFAVVDKKNKGILGAVYRRYYGTPKSGYYYMKPVTKNGKTTYVPSAKKSQLREPKHGFVFNNGNEHYVVYLPNDSQLDRGLRGIRSVLTPTLLNDKDKTVFEKPLKGLGMATNFIARAYTTWNPVWQLMVGFLRDTTTLPTTVAATVFDSPLQATDFAGKYTANLIKNFAELSRLPSTAMSVWGNKAKLAEYIKQNPDSLFAKIVAYRDAGGSTEFAQGLNKDRADDLLFGRLEPTKWENTKAVYDKWNDITSNWAALLENVGRVAAYEALVAGGKTPYEAAAIAKSALDYGQSGEWGRLLNLWYAFFRVGATSTDTIRRAFTKPTGGLDAVKLGKWAPAFMGMGAVAYMLMAAMLGDDEEGEPRINKIDANTLTQRIIFPGSEGDANSFPIGLGLPQLLLTPGILGAAYATGHISGEEATEAYYGVLLRTSPVQPAGWKEGSGPMGFAGSWAKGMLPTVSRPVLEIDTNTNAFGNLVHTEWIDKYKDKADQGMPSTGEEWKDIAQFFRDWGIDMYPEDWAHLSRGYGGQLASEVVRWTIDKERKEMEGVESSAIRTSLRLSVTDEEYYYRNETRQVLQELGASKRRLNAAIEDGNTEGRWLAQNPGDRRRIEAWKVLDKAQAKYYEELAALRDNRLLSDEGRRLQKKRADSRLRQAVERAQRVIDATE